MRQAAIRAKVLKQLVKTWPLLDIARLDATAPGFVDAVTRIVLAGHEMSAREALDYYRAFRLAEGVPGDVPEVMPRPDVDAIRTSVTVTGPVRVKQLSGRGLPVEQAGREALASMLGSAGRHTLNGGRLAQMDAVARDPAAFGVARVAGANACAFCAMLASRGPVYKSELDWSAGFSAHDKCDCEPETVFADGADYKWPKNGQRYRALWDEVIGVAPNNIPAGSRSGAPGQLGSGDNRPLQLFRQALAAKAKG